MTYSEFIDELAKLSIPGSNGNQVSIEWCMGGTYGNCWNDNKEYIEPEPEPEFESLDRILEHFCPDLKFMAYKRIVNTVVNRGSRVSNGYYSSTTTTGYKYFYLYDLYETLQRDNLI